MADFAPVSLSDMFWVNMQARYDAEMAKDELAEQLASIQPLA